MEMFLDLIIRGQKEVSNISISLIQVHPTTMDKKKINK